MPKNGYKIPSASINFIDFSDYSQIQFLNSPSYSPRIITKPAIIFPTFIPICVARIWIV